MSASNHRATSPVSNLADTTGRSRSSNLVAFATLVLAGAFALPIPATEPPPPAASGQETALAQQPASAAVPAEERDIVLARTFDAPVEAVWRAWTDPEQVVRWWGPKGYTSPSAKIDFREGGRYVFAMRAPTAQGGNVMYTAGTFGKIEPMRRIELTQHLSDAEGNPIDPAALGLPPDFPALIPTVVTFKPVAGKTTVTVVESGWTPGPMFDYSEAGMSECLDKLAQILPPR